MLFSEYTYVSFLLFHVSIILCTLNVGYLKLAVYQLNIFVSVYHMNRGIRNNCIPANRSECICVHAVENDRSMVFTRTAESVSALAS